ncbi:Tricorn protease C1 domain-containing protein [Cyclobacterium lianum]|uniref:Tricorn protease C1 domain-containing protein n=1 Tax=Cyclobacterium lianum TaxID=388280 RepID=A0A1M7NUU2_9BACT|nr:S41 family peptidase [Cyclobacterium lianum]SHN07725.1 Tricorn protease C1 domain-containing protein [Cyclobacterium lianum]
MVKQIRLFLLLTFLFCACEQWVLPEDPGTEPAAVFDQLWEDVYARYSFFDHKNLDWQQVRTRYRQEVKEDMGQLELYDLLAEMLFELEDGHVNLSTGFNRSRNWEWYQNFPVNYDENLIEEVYLRRDYWISGPLWHQVLDDVLYVNYRSFGQRISPANLRVVLERAKRGRGVIIDVRNNGGGNLSNASLLASAFAAEETIYARERKKSGPATNDFGPWQDMKISPWEEDTFLGPVVVLTNRRSYSATTFFAQMMKSLPNAITLGDQTGGGGGTPVFGELSNGWTYRFSATQTIDLDERQLEDGVLTDVRVDLSPVAVSRGEDNLISAALRIIRQQ